MIVNQIQGNTQVIQDWITYDIAKEERKRPKIEKHGGPEENNIYNIYEIYWKVYIV